MRIRLAVCAAVLLVLIAGCGSNLDDESYIELLLDKTAYMLEDGMEAEAALEQAAADHHTTTDEVRDFEQELANEPDRLADIVERIMEESAPLREHYIETYRQALPEASDIDDDSTTQ